MVALKIRTKLLVSNSDIIKNYKTCREKAETHGKIFIFKNNQPDAVLFSITEYERLSKVIELTEGFEEDRIAEIVEMLQSKDTSKNI